MSTYIDFMQSIFKNALLTKDFKNAVANYSSEKLASWFQDQGYQVSPDVCSRIIVHYKQ